MIHCIFTLDYEIYGNGEGSLRELVHAPAEKLAGIFRKYGVPLVVFAEAAELDIIAANGTDSAIDGVMRQLRDFQRDGFELGLHIHPQWYNARHEDGRWLLDYGEYNLCTLPEDRIAWIVDRSICFLRSALGDAGFTPFSFRAGNWLFQPTLSAARVLAERGIKVDSSVFKGGVQHRHHLDYRPAARNGHFWAFSDRVETPDPKGGMLEIPIYTQMVPFWKMMTGKRMGFRQKGPSGNPMPQSKIDRIRDLARLRYPLKLDFCRMTHEEFTRMMDSVIARDRVDPGSFRPIVAIGHTKDLEDYETVDSILDHLKRNGIPVSTLRQGYDTCMSLSST